MADTGSGTPAAAAAAESSHDENNSGADDENFADYWDQPGNGDGSVTPPAQVIPPVATQESPIAQFQKFVATMDFGSVMTPDIQSELQNGDFTNFNASMNKTMQKVVEQTVMLTAKMIDHAGQTTKKDVSQLVTGHISSNDAKRALFAAIPAARDKAIAPIAEGVMAQALRRTKGNVDQAVDMTKKYLAAMAKATSSSLGITVVPQGEPGSEGLLSNSDNPQPDWLKDVFGMMKAE